MRRGTCLVDDDTFVILRTPFASRIFIPKLIVMTRPPLPVRALPARLLLLAFLFAVSPTGWLRAAEPPTGRSGPAPTDGAISTDQPLPVFTTSQTLKEETDTLLYMLETIHYNRDAVSPGDWVNVVANYMGQGLEGWDRQKLFFLQSDLDRFQAAYNLNLYYNVERLQNINAAYEIFYVYRQRVDERVAWVLDRLQQDFDFTTDETYEPDRTDSPWPASMAEADSLWQRRLKYELIDEMLSAASPEDSAEVSPEPYSVTNEDLEDFQPLEVWPDPSATPEVAEEQVQIATDEQTPLEKAVEVVRKRYERLQRAVDEYEGPDIAERFLVTIAQLYDPHSTYYSPASYEDFGIQMRLELYGIGAVLSIDDNEYCVVQEIVPGGPANLDKRLQPQDKIVAVAQAGEEPVDVVGWNIRKIVQLIRGPIGTEVRLTVIPHDAPDTRTEIALTRDLVKLNSTRAYGAIFEVPGADGAISPLGVITLPLFYGGSDEGEERSATKDVAELIRQMEESGIDGLVLDLRRNGGGLLSEAIDLAGLFIKSGPIVQVRDYDGNRRADSDVDPSIAYDGPLAVLVDRFSASASEIVAGALQNYGRAVVVGESSTHGKGTVQTIIDIGQTSQFRRSTQKHGAIKLTIQKFYLPNGSSTQQRGVVPDIILRSTDDLLEDIGEQSLARALPWDEIPPTFFEGAPLEKAVIDPLRQASAERQLTLEEFGYLNENIDWFKRRQEELKSVSLNLQAREAQKAANDAFTKQMEDEHDEIAEAHNYAFTEFRLSEPNAAAASDDEEDISSYNDLDIPLRETFRVLEDAIRMAEEPTFSVQAPLTAARTARRS